MKPIAKTLRFPLAGLVKKYPYSTSQNYAERGNYGAPAAMNVRGSCIFQSRLRGGSRPPLVRVGTVATDVGQGTWLWPNGDPIKWPDDKNITFDAFSSSTQAPDGSNMIRTDLLLNPVAKKGALPSGFTITALYRGRVVVIKDNLWYMSRQGDYTDFDLGANMDDIGRAVAGSVALSSDEGETITAVAVFDDSHVFFATKNSLWILRGDPTNGTMTRISGEIGIVSAWAWARNGSTLMFLSNDGVYMLVGESLVRFSEDRLPGTLINVNPVNNTILMAYDVKDRGYHLFVTPDEIAAVGETLAIQPIGTHYWLDVENRAIWPFKMGAQLQPLAVAYVRGDNLETVAILGIDGIWRKFDADATSLNIDELNADRASTVSFGPIQIAPDMGDAMLSEIYCFTASGSASVNVEVCTGPTAEDSVRALNGPPDYWFSASAGFNPVSRPRVRGAWCVITLTSTGSWAFESMSILAKQLGRLR